MIRYLLAASILFADIVSHVSAQSSLPAHVHKTYSWGDTKDLPYDGWMWYNGEGDVGSFVTRFKQYSPVEIKKADGARLDMQWPAFSSDGKWVVGGVVGKNAANQTQYYAFMVRAVDTPDKWRAFPLGIEVHKQMCSFWYNSPYEDAAKGIYEIAWVKDAMNAFAQQVDLSGTEPKLLGTPRQVVKLSSGSNWNAFGAAGDQIHYDAGSPAFNITIPDNGKGMATNANIYKPSGTGDNCASALAPSGALWATNIGGSLRGAFRDGVDYANVTGPVNHDGFVVMRVRKHTEIVVSFYDWVMKPELGGTSVNFVPDTVCLPVGGTSTCYFQHKTGNADNQWYGWRFLQDEQHVIGMHLPSSKSTPVKGGYICHFPSNTWYEIVPRTMRTNWITGWYSGCPVKPWSGQSKVSVTFTSPQPGTVQPPGGPITIEVQASSSAGTISKVEFFVKGTSIGTATSAPYRVSWTPATAATYLISARATDDKGNQGSNDLSIPVKAGAVTKVIRITPSSRLLSPGDTLRFSAVALDDSLNTMPTQPAFTWTVSGGGSLSTTGLFTAGTNEGLFTISAKADGIAGTAEICIRKKCAPVSEGFVFISPQGDQSYRVGDTIDLQFCAASDLNSAVLSISLDNGKSWTDAFDAALQRDETEWGIKPWKVPAEINGVSLAAKDLQLQLAEYQTDKGVSIMSGSIHILAAASARTAANHRGSSFMKLRSSVGRTISITIDSRGHGPSRLRVIDARGTEIFRNELHASRTIQFPVRAPGLYVVDAMQGTHHEKQVIAVW